MATVHLGIAVAIALSGRPAASPPCGLDGDALSLSLDLNVPAYRLDAYADAELIRSYEVAVGAPRYATPIGSFMISEVVWNPWWVPPESEWAAGEQAMPPGPNNPMGRVKMRFGSLVFVHGSPLEESLGRAESHACVRMSNLDAIELARLVHAAGSPGVSSLTLDSLLASPSRTRSFILPAPVPFRVRYEVVEIRDGMMLIHPDVYRRVRNVNEEALRVLRLHGYSDWEVDQGVLREIVGRGARETTSIRVDDLIHRMPSTAPAIDGIG